MIMIIVKIVIKVLDMSMIMIMIAFIFTSEVPQIHFRFAEYLYHVFQRVITLFFMF